jgi:Putative bacterial sensory transduction regulator
LLGLEKIMFLRAILMLACMSIAASQGAHAQTLTVNTSISPRQIAVILDKAGYPSEIASINTTQRGLLGQIVKTKIDGQGVNVYFFDCNGTDCKSFQITLGLAPEPRFTLDFANRWNRETRFVRGLLAANGNFVMQYDIEVTGGVTDACLTNSFAMFHQVLTDFDKFK